MTIKVALLAAITTALAGCSGYIAGDLEDIDDKYIFEHCTQKQTEYEIRVSTEASNDYGDENIAGLITTLTLGLIPTYWLSVEQSLTEISKGGAVVYSREDKSIIHKFYGTIWLFFHIDSINELNADEGEGLRIKEGIKARALKKSQLNMPKDIETENVCFKST